jgi:hypothetical protein
MALARASRTAEACAGLSGTSYTDPVGRRSVSSVRRKEREERRTSASSPRRLDDPARQDFRHRRRIDLHQVGHKRRYTLIRHIRIPILLLPKRHISQPQDRRQHPKDIILLLRGDTDSIHRLEGFGPIGYVVDTGDLEAVGAGGVGVGFGTLEAVRVALGGGGALGELVEDVEVALGVDLAGYAVLCKTARSE